MASDFIGQLVGLQGNRRGCFTNGANSQAIGGESYQWSRCNATVKSGSIFPHWPETFQRV